MLKKGIHPKIVQERLGHSSIQITLDTYSHVAPGLQEVAAARFDEGLFPQPKSGVVKRGVQFEAEGHFRYCTHSVELLNLSVVLHTHIMGLRKELAPQPPK
jgi:hypothetical protein